MLERPQTADIPTGPGVYLYTDARERVIYVGKARHLRRRVLSYFRAPAQLPIKTAAMMRHAVALQTVSTGTEKEALLLEASLIKRHRPHYNIVLRDDKQYVLFRLSHEHPYPRLEIVRQRRKDKARYFGPFTASGAARQTLKTIHALFSLRRCGDRAMKNRTRPCLYFHLGQCLAPCTEGVDKAAYGALVNQVALFLSGRSKDVITTLNTDMLAASAAEEFERAAELRDTIQAIERTVERQSVVLTDTQRGGDLDVLGIAPLSSGLGLAILFVREGRLIDARTFFWEGLTLDDAPELVRLFCGQYYSSAPVVPPRILVPYLPYDDEVFSASEVLSNNEALTHAKENTDSTSFDIEPEIIPETSPDNSTQTLEALESVLAGFRGASVRVSLAQNIAETQLLDMASINAREAMPKIHEGMELRLSRIFGVAHPIERIECVDVSHTSGAAARVGMVVFVAGKPDHGAFRVITLDHATGNDGEGLTAGDDVGALAHWMERRLEMGAPWPDLLLVDGGRGQVSAVLHVLEAHGRAPLNCVQAVSGLLSSAISESTVSALGETQGNGLFALAGMAKARDETGKADRRAGNVADRLFIPRRTNPLNVREGSPELLFLQHIRDTAHAYALGKHRKARAKLALTSELQRLPGVGPATARLLWQHFPSLQAMLSASTEDLANIDGIGAKKAKLLQERLQTLHTA